MAMLRKCFKFSVIFWFSWFCWVQTVGRLEGGLTYGPLLLFDALIIAVGFLVFRKAPVLDSGLVGISEAKWQDLPGRYPEICKKLFLLSLLPLSVLILSSIFQVPLDWDGMDYHLPPLVEAFQTRSWARSVNPYFPNGFYPKSADVLHLWWMAHFGQWLGLRGGEMMGLVFWFMGLAGSLLTVARSRWVFIAWVAFPLALKLSGSAYADLAGMVSLLAFFYFATNREFFIAAMALGLHASVKFNGLASGFMALLIVLGFAIFSKAKPFGGIKAGALYALFFLVLGAVQPVENYVAQRRPFGPLKCIVLGKDFCDGRVDPNDLVVSPTIDIPKEWPVPLKILKGWMPSQAVPGSDVPTGGFGLIWLLALPVVFHFLRRKLNGESLPVYLGVFLFMTLTDLVIPALWYQRYHLGFGWVLTMLAILPFLYEFPSPRLKGAVAIVLGIQLLWITPSRSWFLGIRSDLDSGEYMAASAKVADNFISIVRAGFPSHWTHPADERSFKLYGLKDKYIGICGEDLRPSLPAYGAALSNQVQWFDSSWEGGKHPCPASFQGNTPLLEVSGTRVYVTD